MRSVVGSDGGTLTMREGGDPAGFPVLSLSGTPGSSTIYARHARDAEERGIRLFSYDRPGYGGSTRLKGRTVADCAADISTVCDALDIDRFCVWGGLGRRPACSRCGRAFAGPGDRCGLARVRRAVRRGGARLPRGDGRAEPGGIRRVIRGRGCAESLDREAAQRAPLV